MINLNSTIRLKIRYQDLTIISHSNQPPTFHAFLTSIKLACQIREGDICTIKWIDEDGDPISINKTIEMEEAFRCMKEARAVEMFIHVFRGFPRMAGLSCFGEDKSVYRRGAKRFPKIYTNNGHRFQAKRLNKTPCFHCNDLIWGLASPGLKCLDCKLCAHKKCHRLVRRMCDVDLPSTKTKQELSQSVYAHAILKAHDKNCGDENYETVMANYIKSRINGGGHIRINEPGGVLNSVSYNSESCLDDFNLLTVIGRGSFAKVVQAEHKKTKCIYAIKIIKKDMVIEDEDMEWIHTEKAVFEIAANHPFLVGLHSCFQTESRLFFVIEFVPGGDLMYHLQQKKKLTEDCARFYGAELTIALHFLHCQGIIYRDLKAENVLIDSNGHIKLTDYGMCKSGIGPLDLASTHCGTPSYMAPELVKNVPYGYSVDWWALGVLLFEMMVGRSPFDVSFRNHCKDEDSEDVLFETILNGQIRYPRHLSVRAANLLRRFLVKDPIERLGCDTDLDDAIESIKKQSFFKNYIDWEMLESKQITPQFVPDIQSDRDLKYFAKEFTDESTNMTYIDPVRLAQLEQSEFEGFDYINPLLMAKEEEV